MASDVDICNRALQKLGAKRISSLSQDSTNARSCALAYPIVRDKLLRAHFWNFAIKRAELAASGSAPSWGRANSYQLPSDFLKMAPHYPEFNPNDLDWVIEGTQVLSNDAGPIHVRYVARITTPGLFDSYFCEALATDLAYELCEEITQSNGKKQGLLQDKRDIIVDAKLANAFDNVASQPPEDTYVTCRL